MHHSILNRQSHNQPIIQSPNALLDRFDDDVVLGVVHARFEGLHRVAGLDRAGALDGLGAGCRLMAWRGKLCPCECSWAQIGPGLRYPLSYPTAKVFRDEAVNYDLTYAAKH